MKEKLFNLFLFIEDDIVKELGVVCHEMDGTEEQKLAFLKAQVTSDLAVAKRYHPPKKCEKADGQKLNASTPLTSVDVRLLRGLNRVTEIFEEIFMEFCASQRPLHCITSVVDGVPIVDNDFSPVDAPSRNDYLSAYMTDKGFDLPRLLYDDFFLAIKLLFDNSYFVSCAKLIVSFIDTVAFIEYGDVPENYQRWLDTYVDLQRVGVTSEELWEYRNSLVHMTNLESRKVTDGRVKGLVPIVMPQHLREALPVKLAELPTGNINTKNLDIGELIQALGNAIGTWGQSYNDDRKKRRIFIERYDLIISDKRQYMVQIEDFSNNLQK